MIKQVFQNIFSVKNIKKHKQIIFCGIKIKFKYNKRKRYGKKEMIEKIKLLEKETGILRTIIEKSIDITKVPQATGNYRKNQLIKSKLLEFIDYIFKKHKGFIPRDMTATNICGIFDLEYIFPLATGEFEGLKLPIPNNPIEHLYQANCYGARGAVMNFLSVTDCGFAHSKDRYKNSDVDFDELYKQLCKIIENIKSVCVGGGGGIKGSVK